MGRSGNLGILLGVAVTVVTALAMASPAAAGPTCKCRYFGKFYGLGQSICIRGQVATCALVLNNSSWRFTGQACRPSASLPGHEFAVQPKQLRPPAPSR